MDESNVSAIRLDALRVIDSYRVTIPEEYRELHDIDDGDAVELRLADDGGAQFVNRVQRGRVTIPSRIRDEHNIAVGDKVDMELVIR